MKRAGIRALIQLGPVQANVVYCHGIITGVFFCVITHGTAVTSNMHSCTRSLSLDRYLYYLINL